MVYITTYMFNDFYEQYLVLLTMAPRNSRLALSSRALRILSCRSFAKNVRQACGGLSFVGIPDYAAGEALLYNIYPVFYHPSHKFTKCYISIQRVARVAII